MPLGTLDGTPPPFFRQGPSALSKLIFFSALSLLLMVADLRFQVARPVRSMIATSLYPLQWAVLQPVLWARNASNYLDSYNTLQSREALTHYQLGVESQRALQVEQLQLENSRLRALLDLRERVKSPALASQVLYDAADPHARRIIIDKGSLAAVQGGAPVLDEFGILGQVTRVYPLTSEVTLVTDRNQAIPVLNARSGVRGLAFGDPLSGRGALELRYMDAHVDMQAGDLLTTSGVDGVYPPGLPVARVAHIERRADSPFARISCDPVAHVSSALHVLVLQPVTTVAAPVPAPPERTGKGSKP